MRQLAMVAVGLVLLGGCTTTGSSRDDPVAGESACTSRYVDPVTADRRAALDRRLLVRPRVDSLRVQGTSEASGFTGVRADVVDLLDRRGRRVAQVEVVLTPDGRWLAGTWSQCIDS